MMEGSARDPSNNHWRSTCNGLNFMIPCSSAPFEVARLVEDEVDGFTSMLKKIRVVEQALNEAYIHSLKSRW
jgi:hypothetical protein